MKPLKTLLIKLDNRLSFEEIPKFRAAVIEATRREHDLFHNHLGDDQHLFRYPKIQYRSIDGRAALYCLEEATQVIHHFLGQRDLSVRIGRRRETIALDILDMNNALIGIAEVPKRYHLRNWMALNPANYRKFVALAAEGVLAQKAFLQRILTGNLLSTFTGFNLYVEQRIEVAIDTFHAVTTKGYKGQSIIVFDLDFRANVTLPNHIGLGKGVSNGFGVTTLQPTTIPA